MYIANIFNASFKLSHFPDCWKVACVLAFPKPGKNHLFPQNYRPISLLPTMPEIKEEIYKRTEKFYKEQIKGNDILKNLATFNKENAPFKVKHKLPHHLLL